jgi:hypothetical protein
MAVGNEELFKAEFNTGEYEATLNSETASRFN